MQYSIIFPLKCFSILFPISYLFTNNIQNRYKADMNQAKVARTWNKDVDEKKSTNHRMLNQEDLLVSKIRCRKKFLPTRYENCPKASINGMDSMSPACEKICLNITKKGKQPNQPCMKKLCGNCTYSSTQFYDTNIRRAFLSIHRYHRHTFNPLLNSISNVRDNLQIAKLYEGHKPNMKLVTSNSKI